MTSPCSDGRVSVRLAFPFSSLTSWPSVKLTRFADSPDELVLKAVSEEPDCVVIVRFIAHVGVVFVVGGLLPLRMISATEPFCTCGPSGASDHLLYVVVVQPPADVGFVGTVDQ